MSVKQLFEIRIRTAASCVLMGALSGACLVIVFYRPALAWLSWVALIPWLRALWQPPAPSPQPRAALRPSPEPPALSHAAFERGWSWRKAWLTGAIAGTVYYAGILLPLLSVSWWGWGTVQGAQVKQTLSGQAMFMRGAWAIAALWGGLWWGGFSAITWSLRHRSPTVRLLAVPALWVLFLELLGARTVFGLSWGWLGYLLAGDLLTRQFASLAGVVGVGWLIVWVNTLMTLVLEYAPQPWRISARLTMWTNRPVRRAVGLGVAVVVACQAYSLAQLWTPLRVRSDQTLRVALLQGNVTMPKTSDFSAEGLDHTYAPMIDEALKQPVDVLVLPESVWLASLSLDGSRPQRPDPYLVDADLLRRSMTQRLANRNTVLVSGLDTVEQGQPHNSMLYWSRDGLLGAYHKRGLVPFAEFRPALLGRLAPANAIHAADFAYGPGTQTRIVAAGPHRLGSFICQEVLRPDLVRDTVRAGATILITTGNDGVFRSPTVARLQLAAARMRAVENHRWIVRAMKTGVSALIDPWGRVIAAAPLNERGIVLGQATDVVAMTPYTTVGHAFLVILLMGLVACVAGPWVSQRLLKHSNSCVEVSPTNRPMGAARVAAAAPSSTVGGLR